MSQFSIYSGYSQLRTENVETCKEEDAADIMEEERRNLGIEKDIQKINMLLQEANR